MSCSSLVAWVLSVGFLVGNPAWAQDGQTGEVAVETESAVETETEIVSELDVEAPPEVSNEVYLELATVEEDVRRLKERVFRSKATLQLLKELVIEGATMGSRVVIWHIYKLGRTYNLESAQYYLDGKNIYTRIDPSGMLDKEREIRVREQSVPPGTHNLQVHMVLRGNGFGVFSYINTYMFKVQSSYSFAAEEGKMTVLRVIANERSGLGRTYVDRPGVYYEEMSESLRNE